MTTLQRLGLRCSTAFAGLVSTTTALAQGGFLGQVPTIGGTNADIRTTILEILLDVLQFMALIAVVFIVIAGIRLVVSQGEEAEKDKAKKTIIYVIIGLVIIVLASAIVNFVIDTLAN